MRDSLIISTVHIKLFVIFKIILKHVFLLFKTKFDDMIIVFKSVNINIKIILIIKYVFQSNVNHDKSNFSHFEIALKYIESFCKNK